MTGDDSRAARGVRIVSWLWRQVMARKWIWLLALTLPGALLTESCVGGFWRGFTAGGWPENRWIGLAVDVVNATVIG